LKALSKFTINELDKLFSIAIKVDGGEKSLIAIFAYINWEVTPPGACSKMRELFNLFLGRNEIDLGILPKTTDGKVLLRVLQNYRPEPELLRYTNTELKFFKKQKKTAKVERIAEEMGADYLQDIVDPAAPANSENLKNSDAMNI
jgi:hypothetical protein